MLRSNSISAAFFINCMLENSTHRKSHSWLAKYIALSLVLGHWIRILITLCQWIKWKLQWKQTSLPHLPCDVALSFQVTYGVRESTGNDITRLHEIATHTWENIMAEGSSEKMSSESIEDEPFKTVPVKRKRKRGKEEDMDTSDESKRPSFPPAKAEKLMVSL